jgi:hypothetical protein
MKRESQLEFRIITKVSAKDGRLPILIDKVRVKLRDSMKNLDSISIDHSTLSQSFHSTELLKCMVTPKLLSRDGESIQDNNNGGLMKYQRLSETTTGRTTALTSKVMVAAVTSEQFQASTQDGGRCSDIRTTL